MVYARGKYAKAISDRSGMEFPYNEMVKEWNGSFVHKSEFEAKQPQLEPRPHGADAQALQHAKPARIEFPTEDFLPLNPFTTTAASGSLSISFPSNGFNDGTTYVRFRDVKKPVGGVAVTTLELETTLNGNISDSVTTVTLTDASEFPTSGYIVIEKVDQDSSSSTYGQYFNETIKYTGKSGNNLTGCTRGSSAPYRGETPDSTTAGTHSSGAKVFGSYLATAVATTVNTVGQPSTETQYNSLTVPLVSNASSTETGGGFQCTIGPINDRS